MALIPADPVALLGLVITVAGTVFLLATDWPKAYGLTLVILAMFGVQIAFGSARVFAGLALTTPGLLGDGTWWTPFTYMFLHAGIPHLALNLLILISAGPLLEDRIGWKRFLVLYFAAGLFAAVAHVALDLADVIPTAGAVGASGALFGVLTTFAMRYPRERIPFPLIIIVWLPAFIALLIYLGFNLLYMLNPVSRTAWWGHFAGFLVGLVAYEWWRKRGGFEVTEVSAADLPDVDALRPLARDAEMREFLEKAEQFQGDDRNDAEFALAWVHKFLDRARCPEHDAPLEQDGRIARCPSGDLEVRY